MLGIGTVQLTVKAVPDSFTVYGTSVIELNNVLHVPSAVCNVLGRSLASMYQINIGGSSLESGLHSKGGLTLNGTQIAYFSRTSRNIPLLAVLPPKGSQFGPTLFDDAVTSYTWPNEERVRWQTTQLKAAFKYATPQQEEPYTFKELEWVDEQWGTEFRFLALYKLEVTDEGDRSEGRRIARALMRGKEPFETGAKDFQIEGGLGDFLRPECCTGARHRRDVTAPRMPFL